MRFLGHIVLEKGLSIDPTKVEAIQEWNITKNAMKVRSFLVLASYYKFIKDFARIAVLPTHLTKIILVFLWNERSMEAFKKLKESLIIALVLTILDRIKPFIVYTDACNMELGALLMQEDRVIAYANRCLKDYEKRYPTYDLEF